MACNCGSRGNTYNRQPTKHVARTNAPSSIPPTIIQRDIRQPVNGPDPKNFCRICGWLLKKSRYVDVKTKGVIERIQCTNPKCSTNR